MRSSSKHIRNKKILFTFIVVVIFIPFIQQNVKLFSEHKLRGAYKLAEKPEFSMKKWVSGEYQVEAQTFVKDNFGFRPTFVRIYNQMYYNFYNIAKANGVIIGKDNYLFEENYIKAHLGLDFIGEKAIREKVFKIKKIQDTLATKGIDLIVMLAPGKASFNPEYIPDKFFINRNDSTNYSYYKKEIEANDIKLLDFNKWFIDLKDTIRYKLFPKNGIHWSVYAQAMVTDSLFKYFNDVLPTKGFPNLELYNISKSFEMRNEEQDIENGMNLVVDIPDIEMSYPTVKVVNRGGIVKEPKLLTIGDSYYWGIIKLANSKGLLSKSSFWFYNKQVFPYSDSIDLKVEDIDVQSEIEQNDVILLMATDANLYKFAYGFIDNVYDIYYTKLEDRVWYKKEQRILSYMKIMRDDPKQNQQIKEKALKNNVLFEEELRSNAKYMIWVENGKP